MDGGGDALAAFVVFLIVLWGGTMGATLLLTRFRLTSGDATLADQLTVRGVALLSVTIAMWSLASIAGRVQAVPDASHIVPYLWLAAAAPLFVPPVKSNGVTLVTSEKWVYVSVVLTATGGFVLAMVTMARVLSGGVTLQ